MIFAGGIKKRLRRTCRRYQGVRIDIDDKLMNEVLKATGLGGYFRFCQYGTEVATRADMVRQAINRAEKLTGRRFAGRDIVIIGDSVRDIECGRHFHALTIAVATGFLTWRTTGR